MFSIQKFYVVPTLYVCFVWILDSHYFNNYFIHCINSLGFKAAIAFKVRYELSF
jgi:hypothetical protein